MAFDFPNSPTNGQVFAPTGGPVYVYTGGVWRMQGSGQVVTAEARNRIVNGAMQISQELGSSSTSVAGAYPADQWPYYFVGPGVAAARVVGAASANGNPNRLTMTISGAKPSLAAGDFVQYFQPIEGIRISDWQWGTAQAKQVVLRFTTNVHVAGNYTVCLRNGALDRSWLGSFNIPVAGVDTTVTMVIPGDTTGTWPKDTSNGATLVFSYAVGSTYLGVAGWQAGDKRGITGMANAASITGSLGLTDVGLYLDPNATGVPPPWQMPDEAQELAACRRYFEQKTLVARWDLAASVSTGMGFGFGMVEKRVAPAFAAITYQDLTQFSGVANWGPANTSNSYFVITTPIAGPVLRSFAVIASMNARM